MRISKLKSNFFSEFQQLRGIITMQNISCVGTFCNSNSIFFNFQQFWPKKKFLFYFIYIYFWFIVNYFVPNISFVGMVIKYDFKVAIEGVFIFKRQTSLNPKHVFTLGHKVMGYLASKINPNCVGQKEWGLFKAKKTWDYWEEIHEKMWILGTTWQV